MRIAHLIPQFYPRVGGAEVCVHNICSKLSGSGHQAVVVTTSPPPKNPPNLPYKIEYLWEKTCGMFRRLPKFIGSRYLNYALGKLQDKYSFDLWQVTNGWPLGAFAVDFFRNQKIPCVLRCCGEDIQKYSQIGYGVRLDIRIDKIIKEKFPRFNSFVALTPSVKYEYNNIGIPDEKIRIIPNGADTSKFLKLSDGKKDEVRKKFQLKYPPSYPLILTVGRYHPKKGFDIIPEIASLLNQRGIAFNWIIAGRGTKNILHKYPKAKDIGVCPVEDFSGICEEDVFDLPSGDLIELYCASDIFVLPTLIETFGMVLVEAMAAGLPVITTDAPGVRDVVCDGKEGLITPVGDVNSLADKIELLLKDKLLHNNLKKGALESSKKYDWDNVCRMYLELYENTILT
ncbi:MAG TPA: glycosyltransferase family 4 protein [Victivallales bacterium]|nr:glycosyltransferase family 4 protein [Victivallales bacterium]